MYICIGDNWAGREGFQVRSGKIVAKTSSLLTQVPLYLVFCFHYRWVHCLILRAISVELHAFHISVNSRQSQELRSPPFALQNFSRFPNEYHDVLLL